MVCYRNKRHHHSLLDEPRKPSNSRILEPLRVKRTLRRSFPLGIIGSDAGLSVAPESVGEVSGFPETTLAGIQRLKRLRRVVSFLLEAVIFASLNQ